MALAIYFDKIALGASQILSKFNRKGFEEKLLSQRVLIQIDEKSISLREGRKTLELLIRLVSRLYPNIQVMKTDGDCDVQEYHELAKSINSKIEFFKFEEATVCISIGSAIAPTGVPAFYIGSNGWIVHYSVLHPVPTNDSSNPFGAGAAACFGAANLFRFVFSEELVNGGLDSDFSISLLDYKLSSVENSLNVSNLKLDEVVLAGVGAIGNGAIWALKNLDDISGVIHLVDKESVEISNMQRYVLTNQNTENILKVKAAESYLSGASLTVLPFDNTWEEYIAMRATSRIATVFSCVDSAEDRIFIQGTLPKTIYNAWTQKSNLGVSKHSDFGNDVCLCCLYYPKGPKISLSLEVAINLGIPNHEPKIREYLANNYIVDDLLLNIIASENGIQPSVLSDFVGKPIRIFYSEVVCGGTLLKMKENMEAPTNEIQVPLAFESCLAGILLIAEYIKNSQGYSTGDKNTSIQFNLMRPLAGYFVFPEVKYTSCICSDPDFIEVYQEKWRGESNL